MKRYLVVIPVVLTAAAVLWYALRDDTAPRHAETRRPVTTGHEGETVRAVEWEAWGERGAELADPVVLFGVVLGPQGRPVRKAEVFVVAPVPQLAFTGADGTYELTLRHAGQHLVEARLHLDMAPQRRVVLVPEAGGPPRTDFRLKPAGHVFGEVVVGEAPVFSGSVDILSVDLFGDAEHELDTDIDNGFYNFAWEPPRDTPLRLVVRTDEGFMDKPIDFQFDGERLHLDRIRLTRYPTIRVRMQLPNGDYAKEVQAIERKHMRPMFHGFVSAEARYVGLSSRIRVPTRQGGTRQLVLFTPNLEYRLLRRVDLVLDQLYELVVRVRPGPITVRRRLTDEHGTPIRARFRIASHTVESGPDGWFSCELPHGGLFDGVLEAIWLPRHDWVRLESHPSSSDAFVVDGDDATDASRLALDGRVLTLVPREPLVVLGGSDGPLWFAEAPPAGSGTWGSLSRCLPAGRYAWVYERKKKRPALESGRPFEVTERGLTVVDAR